MNHNQNIQSPLTVLVPGKTDAQLAEDFKARILKIWEPVLALLDEAQSANFIVNVSTGPNAFGKQVITNLVIARKF